MLAGAIPSYRWPRPVNGRGSHESVDDVQDGIGGSGRLVGVGRLHRWIRWRQSRGETAPVTLRIGTNDDPGKPGAAQIEEFSRQVQELSKGQVRIEPVWRAAGDADDWDQVVARRVVRGDLDMGMIPARAWDTEGVTSLRALHAPFLVTSDDLAGQIVKG